MRRTGQPLRYVQVFAALLMVASVAGMLIVSALPSFDARTLRIEGARFTSEAIVRSILGMDGSPNLFRVHTDGAADQLVRLPAVQSATVRAILPSTIVVTLVERQPKLIWVIGDQRFVVDQNGLLFGMVDTAGNPIPSSAGPSVSPSPDSAASESPSPTDSPTSVATPPPTPTPKPTAKPTPTPKPSPTPKKNPKATPTRAAKATPSPTPSPEPTPTPNPSLIPSLAPAPTTDPATTPGPRDVGLPVVFDRRSTDAGLGLGGTIDPTNLDAGYRIAGLTPGDVGSTASSLAVVLDDAYGFTVSSVPMGWVAEFGFYAPTVRQVSVIPGQVRDLRLLLLQYGDDHVAWVWLVADVAANHVNTYLPR